MIFLLDRHLTALIKVRFMLSEIVLLDPTITVEYCLRISLFDFTEHRLTQPWRSILRMIPPVSSYQCSLMLTKRHPMLLETQAYKARPYVCLSLNEEQLER